ncbi:glycosyl hydrolase family 47-domain-containing protein [Cokeromyces recurvatus]|uniref:glycosyl hydrolase family 47-domain-containing protein n=1 Tax=Cokeromyces recurvatus TaxID=90255 RepID=UPI00221EE5D3|nr:glycosyl hydrolase family 47-domain-containing protein [Cokeromyces recurvatus]KAI7899530.1 glycosyl hydrolase family 47-domain-containing protein [Cokeromyces recurvatus]
MFLSYAIKLSKRWKIILFTLCALILLGHLWILAYPRPSLISNHNPNSLPPMDKVNKEENVITQIEEELPTPEKKSILFGFGGFLSKLPKLQYDFGPEPIEFTEFREKRREAIKKSFIHGWKGYKTYALGHDELRPLSNKPKNPFGGWGATMIDSLSTMLIMELTDEFLSVIPRLHKINFKVDEEISVFESTIRYLGGFLSAYELSDRKHDILLQKANKLAQELLPAFDTPSGLPHHLWNPLKNKPNNDETLIAEVGTIQLEFMMLSQLTGNPIYGQKAQAITDYLDNMGYEHGLYIQGLFPTVINVQRGHFKDAISTFGAMGDSAFEYFLKEYLLMNGAVPQYGQMYIRSIKNMKKYMLRQVPGYDLLMLPPFDTQYKTHRDAMDHLTCFVPGMLAMGSKTFNEPEDMEIAKGLLETCVYMYRITSTGLSPESWVISNTESYNPLTFNKTKNDLAKLRDWWYEDNKTVINQTYTSQEENKSGYVIDYELPLVRERPRSLYFGDKRYMLRPETIESLFILYRMTGDQKYQEYGWEIYKAIEKWCKTKSAYAAIRNVDVNLTANNTNIEFNQIDSMESFLFAETFKYLYLLFSPPEIVSLDKFIFNTEAHPFVRKQWNWSRILKGEGE